MQYKEETLYIFFATSIFVGTYINHIVGWISSIVVAMFVGYFSDFFGLYVFFEDTFSLKQLYILNIYSLVEDLD